MRTQPFGAQETSGIIDDFYRDGYAVVRGVLSAEECAHLRALTDEIANRPSVQEASKGWFVVREVEREDIAFARLFIREPIYGLVREILGPECRFCGQNVIRNKPGEAVSKWHVDDNNRLEHPLPPEIPRWPAGARLPLIWLSVQVPLTDVLALEDGPTEIVPGSHYSGRLPDVDHLEFEGRGVEPIFCRAGDIYLFNHQTWHHGRPNTGAKTRYLMQLQYARGDSLAFRCSVAEPNAAFDKVLAGADPRLVQVMTGRAKYV